MWLKGIGFFFSKIIHFFLPFKDKLGISKNYNFGQVVEQLRMAIVCWNRQSSEPSGMDLIKFQDSIKKIYLEFSKKKSHVVTQFLEKAHLNDWVWHGNGFAPPHKVAFLARFPSNISLHPYLFLLPKEFQALKDFLLPFGVKEEFTDDDLLSVLWGIKARCDKMEQSAEVAIQDLDSCRVILEWVVRGGRTLSDESRSKLVIPVQTSTSQLRLEPCNTCTYCDREFLRRGGSESDVTTDFHLIHEAIPDHLASSLGVPRLSSCLVDPEPFEFEIEEAGQYEPITTRLRNILQEYKEGVGIFKELIQNADDAGASKVCFVVDWRDSPRVKLLTSEMAKCQGPALWAYNNAMFSKKDFENINKLAGETKKEDLDKVGRFGLGFNAVYHLTDVPSFISGEYFVVFDPNMNHIADMIDKKSRPGMKINLAKSKKVLSLFPDQFLPYHELFGCNTKSTKTGTFRYEGTLFRFPLRTKQQAEKSEICPNPYSPDDICRVFESLRESSSTLLLFAQNVKQVRVFEMRKDSNPASALGEPIISISKGVEKIFHSNGADRDGKGMFLRNCSNWWRHRSKEKEHRGAEEGPRRTELMKISISVKESKITKAEECTKQQDTWLVNSCAGNSTSIKIAESDNGCKHGVLPIAGAAVKLSLSKSESESPHYAKIHSVPGEVFCFLPLSFSSGLPVHVNGYFSVHSNRRGIWEEGVGEHDSHKPFEALWNKALMEDALAQAYLQLLEVVTCQADKQYEFHSLWPNPTVISHPKAWKPFIDAFFQKIIDERKPLFLCNKEWRPLQDCLILDSKLAKVTECLSIMNILCVHVLSIPEVLLEGFRACGKTAFINEQTLTEEKFLRHYFFPNVAKVPIEMRDSVLLHVLDRRLSKHRNYDDLFERYACFNCSRDGKTLRKSSELVHPRGQAACLFSEEEKKFPVEQRFLTKERAMMLEDLGMIVDSLSWDGICGRAEWISNRGSKERQRAGYLVHYLNGFLERPSHPKPTAEHNTRLSTARFLPFLEKPKEYAFPWKANHLPAKSLVAANALYPDNLKSLIGSSQLILDESSIDFGKFTKTLKNILGLNSKQPELYDILAQLDYVIKHVTASGAQECLKIVCSAMYDHFQKIATYEKHASKRTLLRKELDRRPWMLIKGQMVTTKRVAMKWDNKDGSPYLYTISDVYNTRYRALVEWYGVKKEFTSDDFLQAIWKLREDTNGRKLTEQQLDVLCNFLGEVYRIQDLDLKNLGKPIPLPNSDSVLHDSTELAINDAPWIEHDSCIQYVHEKIPISWSYKFRAKDLRTAVLSFCSEPIGQPFGQHELLTDRLNGILKSYPADEGILKELIQNADDANASEIHFVYDPRTHESDRIFSENWKELQGPAICVYNDQRFSSDDIRGIQNLGIGSKVDDAEKTGQYGIGFNAIYHLTDCPSFLSDDEVLCVFDPHRHYVPGATEEHPGRLYNKLDNKFRRNFIGIFSGFLREFFNLQGGTMFRFPLRRRDKFQSKISETYFSESKIRDLLGIFRNTAKKMLLFLNNVKKISISEVNDGKLETYSVCCTVSDEEKRSVFAQKIKQHKNTSTDQVPWHNIHYTLTLSDSRNVKQDWLVSQSLGCKQVSPDSLSIPNGRKWGLLPRAGIAARLPSADSGFSPPMRHQAFCFLPLPVSVSLPVHVNGHFALDSARRDLWHDPKTSDERTAWNEFVKRQVVAPTYASLILEAREYMKGYEKQSDRSALFTSEQETEVGLSWYHALFPSTERTADSWKTVGEALYLYLTHNAMPVLPVAHSLPLQKQPERLRHLSLMKTPSVVKQVQVDWRDVAEVFFCHDDLNDSWPLEKCLLDVGIPLLSYTPTKICAGFKSGGKAKEVDPVAVTDFLRTHSVLKDQLPKSVTDTALLDHHNVYALTKYCSKEDGFFENLHGLPLLLTQDEVLRCFTSSAPVFCSRFSDLLPSKQEHFLHKHLKIIFESNVTKCSGIVQDFDISHLSKFKDAVPINWIDSAVHQPWNPSAKSDSRPSKEWLKLLWEFIHHLSFKTGNTDILGSIDSWPIIPTTQNCLVTVSMSKTVLNVSSILNCDSKVDGERRKVLTKLNCPQLENTIMPSQQDFRHGTGSAAVLKHYLALIQSPTDVLYLLDHTMSKENGQSQAKLSDEEIQQLLTFLQSDVRNLSYTSLRNLPFYKTIHGNHVRLSTYHIAYEIPVDQPSNELNTLSKVTNCVFLYQAPMLKALYESIGIQQASSVYFYLSIVFKHFSQLTSPGRISHLQYVRDSLMPSLLAKQHDHQLLLHALKELRFIPDKSGLIHQACKFYDSRNKVFSAFLKKEMFPPCPFDADEWKEFLLKAGLQTQVTPEQALKYANYVGNEVSKASILQQNGIYDKSRILVSYLFENPHLQDHAFLQKIAKIRFVPGAEIRNSLLAVHDAYGCPARSPTSNYVQFEGSVVSEYMDLVWSSAALLSPLVRPPADLQEKLKIHGKPPLQVVLAHTKNVVNRFYDAKQKQVVENLRCTLIEVMDRLYQYFKKCCPSSEPFSSHSNCSPQCLAVCEALRDVPVIMVDNQFLVRGIQLSFKGFLKSLEPHMFNVPRNLFQYEHLLKGLGAQEYPTPRQYATVLQAIKSSCEDTEMHPVEKSTAISAVRGLFRSLHRASAETHEQNTFVYDESQTLSGVAILYLPSEDGCLRRSTDLLVNNRMEKKTRLKEHCHNLLVDFASKDQEPTDKLVELLPPHLKLQKLSDHISDELDPKCVDKVCVFETNSSNQERCPFIQRYRRLLCSPQFSEALIRLFKSQENVARVREEVKKSLESMQESVEIRCMRSIETRLVSKETGEPIEGSERDVGYFFCQNDGGGFKILIRHDEGEKDPSLLHHELSSFIHQITGRHIKKENWRFLMLILGSGDPAEIHSRLDEAHVPGHMSNSWKEPDPGDPIPEHFHFLLRSDIDYYLRKGELVAYELQEEDNMHDPVYVFATVIEQTNEGKGF